MNKITLVVASAAFCLAQGAIAAPNPNRGATSSPTLTPAGTPTCSNSIVTDCSFESGSPSTGWTEYSLNFGSPICDDSGCGTGGAPIGPNSGDFWVWLGGIADTEEGSVTQSVTIPAAASATLSFAFMAPVCSGDTQDYVEATMDGVRVWSVDATNATYCGVNSAYTTIAVDVSAYADGGSHTLAFHSEVFGVSGTTNFWIDDVDLETQAGGGGPAQTAIELPSLGMSAMIGLGALLALLGFAGLRRRRMN